MNPTPPKSRGTLLEQRKANSARNAKQSETRSQGIRKDQRGQEQPTDQKRALRNK